MAEYVHHVPGRLRVKCPTLKGNAARAETATQLLRSQEGIASCEVNPVTGSVLVRYDEANTNVYRVLDVLQRGGYIGSGIDLHAQDRSLEDTVSGVGKMVSKAVVTAMVERMVERSAVALVGAIL
ncbi:MAG: HMA2 domain-containing protein [Gammaproteobacteria bacterium]